MRVISRKVLKKNKTGHSNTPMSSTVGRVNGAKSKKSLIEEAQRYDYMRAQEKAALEVFKQEEERKVQVAPLPEVKPVGATKVRKRARVSRRRRWCLALIHLNIYF